MKTSTTNAGLKVKASVKAGAFGAGNHTRGALKVKTAIKAGFACHKNHNVRLSRIA